MVNRMTRSIFVLLMVFLTCDIAVAQVIDGSSQARYQQTLTEVIGETPQEYRLEIIHMLDEKYQEFKTMFPAFAMSSNSSVDIRPPEYLALLNGLTVNDLIAEARERTSRREVPGQVAYQQSYDDPGQLADPMESSWVRSHYIEIILIP